MRALISSVSFHTVRSFMKNKLLSLGLVAAALFSGSVAHAAPVVSFSPSSMSVAVGGPYLVDVNISGLGSQIVSAFDLNIKYNPAIIGFTGYTLGAGLGGLWDSVDASVPPMDFGVQAFSLEGDDDVLAGDQTDDAFTLMTLSFNGLNDGFSFLSFGNSPDFEINLVGRRGESLTDVSYGRACIAVGQGSCATVPEPQSYALVALALVGAFVPALWRRRQTAVSVAS
ncbi:PEP-CTERM sorting domain-containing protein [Paucibacter sp. M5-1]|uniref:PEP-CTERM sorting domain-containing protein n=1 Tax=Paucibacter sp. M5-1 TaxID=3015998 RepID=UPI003F8052DC